MYRLILVRFDRDTGRFEDEEFNKFCAEQSIVRIEKEFINTGGEIYYSFFIEYVSRKVSRGKTSTDDLSELELAQYNALRDWRNELASGEGIPAYIIMYNSQIHDIVKRQPEIKARLDKGNLLIISPFEESVTAVTPRTCLIRNNLIVELADKIVIGYASPGGQISKLLHDLDKPLELLDYSG